MTCRLGGWAATSARGIALRAIGAVLAGPHSERQADHFAINCSRAGYDWFHAAIRSGACWHEGTGQVCCQIMSCVGTSSMAGAAKGTLVRGSPRPRAHKPSLPEWLAFGQTMPLKKPRDGTGRRLLGMGIGVGTHRRIASPVCPGIISPCKTPRASPQSQS
jgi:hypothetical protein